MYDIEIKPASKNGYFTPAEARNYYGKYSRDGITIHWWGDGSGASNHDNIVNYLNGNAARGDAPTVNYVLSDNKITLCINPDDVAWCSGNGNPTTISVECQPTLGAEGYKKAGWLIWQLELRYGKTLKIYGHRDWANTACPGTLDLNRMRAEADKWRAGGYNPTPEWLKNRKSFTSREMYTAFDNSKLVDVNTLASIKTYAKDTPIEVGGETSVAGKEFWISVYSMQKNLPNGFLKADLKDKPTPPPVPPATKPEPEPELPNYDKENNALLKQILALVQKIWDKLVSIFK